MAWAVPASDSSGVWRVVIVYNDESLNADNRGTWVPLDLMDDGTGVWRGSAAFPTASRVTYVIQAVDNRGNVEWLDYVSTETPSRTRSSAPGVSNCLTRSRATKSGMRNQLR